MIYQNIEELIGNTPLLKLRESSHGLKNIDVYAKLEYMNPFGSVKDRTVLGLTKDIDFDKLRSRNAKLIESSSGNTAKTMQIIARRNGTSMISVTNRVKVPEVDNLLRYLGAEIISLPGRSECPDPTDDDNAIARIEKMISADAQALVHTDQYSNQANSGIHQTTTAHEIFDDLSRIDYIIASVGTGGTSGGILKHITTNKLPTKTIGVAAHPSDFIPGIRTMNELFETALFDKNAFTSIEEVTSSDALTALDILVQNEGILAGPTTGATFAALTHYLKDFDTLHEDGSRKSVVFIACDRLEPYMSYVTKRLPERFGLNAKDDIFNTYVTSQEKNIYEKSANTATYEWTTRSNVQVIDIRGVKPFSMFHLEKSLSYPEEILREVLEQATPFDSSKPVLFVCPKGDRSLLIAAVLRKRGTEAYSLAGGLMAWRSAGLPMTRGGDNG